MNSLKFKCFTLLFVFNTILIVNIYAQQTPQIQIVDKKPSWGKDLSTINLGKYGEFLIQDNPKEEILAFQTWGDRSIDIIPPFNQFLYLTVDKKDVFLKFISIKKNGKHYIQTYRNGPIKVILDYNGQRVSNSGNGSGGIFYFYYADKLINKFEFWSGIL
jgi:hypothetical protein